MHISLKATPADTLMGKWLNLARRPLIVRPMPEEHKARLEAWELEFNQAQSAGRSLPNLPDGFFLEKEPEVAPPEHNKGPISVTLLICHDSQIASREEEEEAKIVVPVSIGPNLNSGLL